MFAFSRINYSFPIYIFEHSHTSMQLLPSALFVISMLGMSSSVRLLGKRSRGLVRLASSSSSASSSSPPSASKTFLLEYSYVADILEKRTPHRPAHLALAEGLTKEGVIVAGGATGSPPSGALFIFKAASASTVEAFVKNDPYVSAGLVTAWKVKEWTVAVGSV